jgi:hypothetical protein
MKTAVTFILILIIVLSSVLCVSATISHTTEQHNSYYSLNHLDDDYSNSDINYENTFTNTDYYSGGEWSLTFTANT